MKTYVKWRNHERWISGSNRLVRTRGVDDRFAGSLRPSFHGGSPFAPPYCCDRRKASLWGRFFISPPGGGSVRRERKKPNGGVGFAPLWKRSGWGFFFFFW